MLISSIIKSNAASKAAKVQQRAADENIAESRRQFDQTRQDLMPFQDAGIRRLAQVDEFMGSLPSNMQMGQVAGQPSSAQQGNPLAGFNASAFGQIAQDPRVSRNINAMFGAKGMGLDGAAMRAQTRAAQDSLYGRFTDYANMASSGSAQGAGISQNLGQMGASMANQNAQNRMAGAGARASSYQQQGNIWGNTVGNAFNAFARSRGMGG